MLEPNTRLLLQTDSSVPSGLIKREEIDNKYKWNLSDIYENEEEWEKDFNYLLEKTKEYKKFEGTLAESAENLRKALEFDEETGIKFGKVHLYSFLSKDLDLGNTRYQGLYDRVTNLGSSIAAESAYLIPEILSIPEQILEGFIEADPFLKVYEHNLKDLLRRKEHTLSKDKEELLAQAGPALQTAYNTYSLLKNADMQFPEVEDENGNKIEISDGRFYAALYSENRDYRRRVYKGYYKPYTDYSNTISALFNGNIKAVSFESKIRKYESDRHAALDVNNIPVSVYDNLVKTASENTAPLHRWAALKKRILGVDELHPYDTYVSLFQSVKKEYSYDESVEIVTESLKPLGEDYIKSLQRAFDERWIDVFETKGKRSGAYSSGTTFGIHPYVLLNWNNQLNDVFTLTHEMGHNMHSYYTGITQPYPYANYSIFVAEVASTMNEALLLDYLIERAESKEEKLALIEKNLMNITLTFYRQTRFAQFEQKVHEMSSAGVPLTPDILTSMFGDTYKHYWGGSMVMDEEEGYTWARIPHFYYNFYVYQYATSFAASQALSAKLKKEGQPAIEKYLDFLKAGNSVYPIELLARTGVDMNTPEPVLSVVRKMDTLLDEMEKLLAE